MPSESTEAASPGAEGSLSQQLAVAQSLLDAGKVGEALLRLTALESAHARSAPLSNKMGVCLARMGRLEEAEARFREAAELDPSFAPAWSNLGNVYLERGRLQEAEDAYRHALQLDPSYAQAHRNLAAALKRMGRLDEAVRHLKEAVRLEQELPRQSRPREATRWLLYAGLGVVILLYWLSRHGLKTVAGLLIAGGMLLASAGAPARAEAAGSEPAETRRVWRFPEGISLAGVDVASLTVEEARASLQTFASSLLRQPVVLRAPGARWEVVPAQVGIEPDVELMLGKALSAALEGRRAVVGLELRRPTTREWAALVQSLARQLEVAPEPPRVYVRRDGEAEIVPGRSGRRIDREGLERALIGASAALKLRAADVPLRAVPPAPSVEDLQALRRPRLLASYQTRFDPAAEERTANIAIAAAALDGMVLKPGATFSFNEAVGPRITERGYRTAPVILDGQLVPDVGGGVCQVSSTLYNAALLAGLEARRRAPHSIPVWYVPLARDATVAYGLIDLRLVNPTGDYLAVSARVEGGRLQVALWGPPEAQPLPWRLRTLVERAIPAGLPPAAGQAEATAQPNAARTGYVATLWRELPLYGPWAWRQQINRSVYRPYPAAAAPASEEGKTEAPVNMDAHAPVPNS
ncbi:MAG: VanW family protein [Limnochordaceae bacterium]|nr:VanW family protein [Limnochordaceae bacterium]